MENKTSQNDILSMLAQQLEASIANDKRSEALRNDGSVDFRAAVEVTADRLKSIYKIESGGIGSNFLEGLLYYRDYLPKNPTDVDIANLIKESSSNFKAFQVLELLEKLTKDTKNVPSLERWKNEKYLGLYQTPKKPSGTAAYVNLHRDTLIVRAIKSLVSPGLCATRDKAKPGISACDVVVEALASNGLKLSYDAIESIWTRREKLQKPVLLAEMFEEILGLPLS
jgi:hypothetical protein